MAMETKGILIPEFQIRNPRFCIFRLILFFRFQKDPFEIEHTYIFTNNGPSFTNKETTIELFIPNTNYTYNPNFEKIQPKDVNCRNGSTPSNYHGNCTSILGCTNFICEVPARWEKDDQKTISVVLWFNATAANIDPRDIFEIETATSIANKGKSSLDYNKKTIHT